MTPKLQRKKSLVGKVLVVPREFIVAVGLDGEKIMSVDIDLEFIIQELKRSGTL